MSQHQPPETSDASYQTEYFRGEDAIPDEATANYVNIWLDKRHIVTLIRHKSGAWVEDPITQADVVRTWPGVATWIADHQERHPHAVTPGPNHDTSFLLDEFRRQVSRIDSLVRAINSVEDPSHNAHVAAWKADARGRYVTATQLATQLDISLTAGGSLPASWSTAQRTEYRPKVEIAGYRDPDSDTDLDVFVDGVPRDDLLVDIVDPGAGYPYQLSEWRRNIFDAARSGGTPAWTEKIIELYSRAEEKYTIDDTTPARDAQPGVTDLAELDPVVWIGEGMTGDTKDDNTVQAGWALAAVLGAHAVMQAGAGFLPAAEAARRAYTEVAYDAATGDGQIDTVVQNILTGLRHLADAKVLDLDRPPGSAGESDELQILVDTVIASLQHEWERLPAPEHTWAQVEAAAFDRYIEDVTGEWRLVHG